MRRLIILATLALLAGGAGWVAALPREGGPQPRAAGKPAIKIRGSVNGLYPGASKRLLLRLHNRSRRDLIVTSIRARVADASRRCPARNLKVRTKRVHRRVPGRATRRVGYRVGMIVHARKSCQDARFPLRYRAEVRR
jgi:hypothetical protein